MLGRSRKTKTSKTPEGRSATFGVQGLGFFVPLFFLTSIAERFLSAFPLKNQFFEPSREVLLGGLFFFSDFFLKCFFLFFHVVFLFFSVF